jgi:hypothetical protein
MRKPFSDDERAARAAVRAAFPVKTLGTRGLRAIYCRRDKRDPAVFCARIDLCSGTWCSTRGATRAEAILNTLALAQEPAPGFPGWVEPTRWRDVYGTELALT